MMRKALIAGMIFCLMSCGGDNQDSINQPPLAPSFSFEYDDGKLFEAQEFKAFAEDTEEEGAKRVLIIASDASGATAELQIKNINKSSSSFSVEKGAQAAFTLNSSELYCTTALTMDNDSSINIDNNDTVTNFLSGHFLGFDCTGSTTRTFGKGAFAVTYEDIAVKNAISLDIDGEEFEPDMVFVNVTPEPVATIRITGFNGGTESYTLILKKDKYDGTYQMNEFDVTPYFFYSDANQNQFDAQSGFVSISAFDVFERTLSGSFEAHMKSGTEERICKGEFNIFVF